MRRFVRFGQMRPDAPDYDEPALQEASNVLPLFDSYWSLRQAAVVSSINDDTPPTSPDGLSGITGSIAHFYTADRSLARHELIEDITVDAGWVRFGPASEDDESLYLQLNDGVTPDDETGILFQPDPTSETTTAVISKNTSGLIFRDDFNRANGSLGTPWNNPTGSGVGPVGISSNRMLAPNDGSSQFASTAFVDLTEEALKTPLVQATAQGQADGQFMIGVTDASGSGYILHRGTTASSFAYTVRRKAGFTGSGIILEEVGSSADLTDNTDYQMQMYLNSDPANETLLFAAEHDTGVFTDDAASGLTLDNIEVMAYAGQFDTSSDTATVQIDNLLWMRGRHIFVSDLPTGWKAKVLNASEAVVAEATESGGVADIIASRADVVGGTPATEFVPFNGWASLIVTDGLDAEQARYNFEGVYPGDTYTFHSSSFGTGSGTYEAKWDEMTDPSSDTDHFLTYRYRFNGQPLAGEPAFDGELRLSLNLIEGISDLGTIVTHTTGTPDDTWVHNQVELPTTITSTITDYSDLRIRGEAEVIGGGRSDKFPNEDIRTNGEWENESGGTISLFQSVDNEPGAAGDSTFIQSPDVAPGGVAFYRSGLEDGDTPFTFEGFRLTVRAAASEEGVELRTHIMEGGEFKASTSFTDIPTSFTDHVFDIPAEDVKELQDFSNLEAFVAVRSSGGGSTGLLSLTPTSFVSKVNTTGNVTALQQDDDVTVDVGGPTVDGGRFRVTLQGGVDPGTNENHQIRLRAHRDASGPGGVSVQLFQGGAVVFDSRDTDGPSGRSLATAEQDEIFTIPASVAANLTYTGLQLQVLNHAPDTGGGTGHYDFAALEVPGGKSAKISSIQFSYPARAWVGLSFAQFSLTDSQAGEIGDITEIYAGTYESIYEVQESGWENVSKAGNYAQTESPRSWHFWPFGANIIATNKADPVQVRAPSDVTFSDLITSTDKPRAATCAVSNHHLVLGNIDFTGPPDGQTDEWWASAFDDPTDFNVSVATGSNRGRLQDTPGEIVKMVGGEFILVFKRNSIHRLDYVGEIAPVFRDSVVSYTDGTRYTRSVVQVGRDVYFYDSDGFKVVRNGSFVEFVGQGQITRFVTDSEFEDFSPRAIPTDREALADTAVIGTYDPVTGLIWWAIRGKPSSTNRVNQEWFNNSVVIYNPKEDRFTVMRTATSAPPFSPCALIGLPGAKQSAETITRGVSAIMMGEDFLTGNFHAEFLRFIGQKTYPASFRTKIWTTKMLLGESFEGFIRGVRPVFRMASALARPDVEVFIDSADDPLMQFDVVPDNSSLAESNEDGWYTFSQMNEFFTFDVQIPEMDRQTIREVAGLEFDLPEKRGSGRY